MPIILMNLKEQYALQRMNEDEFLKIFLKTFGLAVQEISQNSKHTKTLEICDFGVQLEELLTLFLIALWKYKLY